VTITVAAPSAALFEAESVSVLVPEVEAGLKLAVTPAGKPLALNATLPEDPPLGVTVIVVVVLAPRVTATDEGDAAMEKSGVALTVRVIVVV
jgi:hypothetical protein